MERTLVLVGTILCGVACLLVLLAHGGDATAAAWIVGALGYGGATLIGVGVLVHR